jgi:cell wall-associated NlpC family hydrolase
VSNVLSGVVVAQHARAAGFSGDALVTAVAIAKAESGWNATAVGDTTLVSAKWGPSIGLWQVRSLNEQQGTGRERDQIALFDPSFNARSAYSISRGGTYWKPWSVYTSGAYRKHLAAARSAASDPVVAATPTTTPSLGAQPVQGLQLGGPALPITVGGAPVAGSLAAALHGGSVDFTVGQVSELQLEFIDPAYELCKRHKLAIGSVLGFLNLRWSTVEFESNQGPASSHVVLKAHPEGVVFLREALPGPVTNQSATEFLTGWAARAGLRFVGEPSARRPSLAPERIEDKVSGIERTERVWEMGERLEKEEGFYFFESAGTLYFASGNYLLDRAQKIQINHKGLAYGKEHGPSYEALSRPRARATKRTTDPRNPRNDTRAWANPTAGVFYDMHITSRVLLPGAERLRPGMAARFSGVAPFFQGMPHMLRQVKWDLGAEEAIVVAGTLEQKQGVNPAGGTSSATGTTGGSSTTGGLPSRGTRSALDFVTFCLRQVGDKYVFGAEARLDDVDPDAFDCSELIQWACAQVGVDFVDGSINQIAAVRRAGLQLSIDEAAYVRGAVLFRKGNPNHIVVSLGDGRHTIEARGTKYGVVQHTIAGRGWTDAGKIPGLIYPGPDRTA